MTLRQSFLKTIYPLVILKDKVFGGKKSVEQNLHNLKPSTPFYNLTASGNDGKIIRFDNLKGKKVIVVNTASDCGYTAQLEELEKLHKQYEGKLVILGFPSNDFKQQEKRSDEEIAAFCKLNYGITFQLMKKSSVKKNKQQNEVFQWLSEQSKNGWSNKEPEWNFSKYLINEKGVLTHYFGPGISPSSKNIIEAVNRR